MKLPPKRREKVYVVAVSRQEAEALYAADRTMGTDSYPEAVRLLKRVKMPPTDPFYAAQYGIYAVDKLEAIDGL